MVSPSSVASTSHTGKFSLKRFKSQPKLNEFATLSNSTITAKPVKIVDASLAGVEAGNERNYENEELGVALDGSFIETTNQAAAQSLAKYYTASGQAAEYGITTRIDEKGRTIYRIRPISLPTATDILKSPTTPTVTLSPASPTPKKTLRSTRSIPLIPSTSLAAEDSGSNFESETESTSSTPKVYRSPSLRRTGSTPILSSNFNEGSVGRKVSLGSGSDVMGKILGWERDVVGRKVDSNDLRIITEGVYLKEEENDLPDDLMEQLLEGQISISPNSFSPPTGSNTTPENTSRLPPAPSSTFGSGVRLKQSQSSSLRKGKSSVAGLGLSSSNPATPTRFIREISSSESIKTEKAIELPSRFSDSRVFDIFQTFSATNGSISSRPSSAEEEERERDSLSNSSSINSDLSDLARGVNGMEITVCAKPGDDPRFIIWGTTKPAPFISTTMHNNRNRSNSIIGLTDESHGGGNLSSEKSSPATTSSKRWSLKDSPASSIRESIGSIYKPIPERILMAATIERWIAELTCTIESDLLTGFFLSFRSFIKPVDLITLLITRFNWAMEETFTPEDEAGRRIVRVRTFVVIRHWLLNHFQDDFVPDKLLRTTLVNWLNECGKAEEFRSREKDLRLIKGLKKLVRRLKENFVTVGIAQASQIEFREGLGMKVEGPRKVRSGEAVSDEDVDLDIGRSTSVLGKRISASAIGANSSASINLLESDSKSNLSASPNHSLQSAFPLPGSTNIASRTVTSALGSFGRFRRMLSSRTLRKKPSGMSLAGDGAEELEFEPGERGDLLYVKGGLERYLEFFGIQKGDEEEVIMTDDSAAVPTSRFDYSSSLSSQEAKLSHSKSTQTLRSVISRFSFLPNNSSPPKKSNNRVGNYYFTSKPVTTNRIELDDIDLSDEDDDVVEVKKTLRRLPGRNNLRKAETFIQARLSTESISSFGSPQEKNYPSLPYSIASMESELDRESGPQIIANFILEGIEDSDEEIGDVEAALRRLEGVVDVLQEKRKAKKVEAQMDKSLQLERMRMGLGCNVLNEDNFITVPEQGELEAKKKLEMNFVEGSTASLSLENAKSITATENVTVLPLRATKIRSALPTLHLQRPLSRVLPIHRSFLLQYKTTLLAQQFSLIERDLFRILSWQELISGDWRDFSEAVEVLDWGVYLKERRIIDERGKKAGRRTKDDVRGIVARFNLTANWVCSEIILTVNLEERVSLIAKFIRLAFKCYRMSNFQTTTQIVHGLQMMPVECLKKTWSKVPNWEMREFKGLKAFVASNKNFKYLRLVTNALVDEYGPSTSESRRMKSKLAPTGCIPFLGLFLRDLSIAFALPTFLDPTSPNSAAVVDNLGQLLSVVDPSAFDSLSPLPSNVPLLPLINVHKFRLLSELITKILSFQELSLIYSFEPEKEVYFKCLKIKTLTIENLTILAAKLE